MLNSKQYRKDYNYEDGSVKNKLNLFSQCEGKMIPMTYLQSYYTPK